MALRLSTGLRNKLMGIEANLVSNGQFGTNTSGWTGDGASLAANGGVLEITNSGEAAGKAYVDIATREGRIYKLTFEVDNGTGVGVQALVGSTSDEDSIFTSREYTDTTLTEHTIAFVAEGDTTRITFVNTSTTTGHLVQVDNVNCSELLNGFGEIMRGSKVNIYTGSQPASPDDAATGTLLVTLGKNGGASGVEWDQPANGVVSKPSGDSWTGTAVATGTAGWFRFYEEGDDPSGASATAARFDGTAAVSGGQINMTSTSIAADAVQTISSFSYTQPAS